MEEGARAALGSEKEQRERERRQWRREMGRKELKRDGGEVASKGAGRKTWTEPKQGGWGKLRKEHGERVREGMRPAERLLELETDGVAEGGGAVVAHWQPFEKEAHCLRHEEGGKLRRPLA